MLEVQQLHPFEEYQGTEDNDSATTGRSRGSSDVVERLGSVRRTCFRVQRARLQVLLCGDAQQSSPGVHHVAVGGMVEVLGQTVRLSGCRADHTT